MDQVGGLRVVLDDQRLRDGIPSVSDGLHRGRIPTIR
jgi:hypothetical protein